MEPQGTILPIYFVADESRSMASCTAELNDGLISLLSALQREPFTASKVRFSVIGFAEDAITYLELADLRYLPQMPTLRARGESTSFLAAFDQVGYRISVDVPALKSQGFLVNRPVVFFLTDGSPNWDEEWRSARGHLLAQRTAPNILAFGVGEADASMVAAVSTRPANFSFMSARGADTGYAITEFMGALTQSVIHSGQALASGEAALQIEMPTGFSLAVEVLDPLTTVQPGTISLGYIDNDVVGATADHVQFDWGGTNQATFLHKGFRGTAAWPNGHDAEVTLWDSKDDDKAMHFVIRGAAPTAGSSYPGGTDDYEVWWRLGWEIHELIRETSPGSDGSHSLSGDPVVRDAAIKPYIPSY